MNANLAKRKQTISAGTDLVGLLIVVFIIGLFRFLLFVFDDEDADSIVSVLEVLETMDEDGVVVSEVEFSEMITSLNSNTEYAPL